MFSDRRLLEIAILAMPLLLGAVGCGTAKIPASIAGQRARIDFRTDYRQACQEARHTGKPLLVFIKTEWCPFSREMLDETFTNRQVVSACDQFVCVMLDADEQAEICRRLNTNAVYPTTQFVSPSGVVLARIEGARTEKELLAEIQKVLP